MTDVELVAAATRGDVYAFLTLQTRYRSYILGTARRLGFTYPEDVEQDCWLSLLRGRWRPDPSRSGPLFAFLRTMLRRMRAREYRRQSHVARTLISDDCVCSDEPIDVVVPAAPAVDPVDALTWAARAKQLRLAMRRLTRQERDLLRLRYCAQLTMQEIAERDGRSVSGVALALQRAHRQLAEVCGVEYQQPRRGERFIVAPLTARNFNRRRKRRAASRAAKAPASPASSSRPNDECIPLVAAEPRRARGGTEIGRRVCAGAAPGTLGNLTPGGHQNLGADRSGVPPAPDAHRGTK